MTLADYYNRNIPEYYDTMYLDGYTPDQIMTAFRKKMYRDYEARQAAKREEPLSNIGFGIFVFVFILRTQGHS